uniref:Peritrophin-48-like n=1 Tax=Drosophila rhopaloa TaxID=1041015 RepID=A0A6P4EQC8_DRORH
MRMIYYVCSMCALICLMRTSSASVFKDSVKCTEGSVAADVDDCASYFQCLDDEAVHINCPNGSYFEANNEVCVVDEFEICPTSTRKCFEGDLFVDFNDCAAYLICLRGNLVKQKCSLGSYFNIISKSCRLDRRAVCTPQREICKEGERTEDSKDCAGYLECARGALVKKKCPSGSYFEAIFKLCQVDEKGVCSTSSNHCSEGEVQVAPNNCAGYLTCQNGKLETKSCPSGSFLNPL